MNRSNTMLLKIIDKLFFVFFIIFLLSLTNSIFINQLGKYDEMIADFNGLTGNFMKCNSGNKE